MPLLLVPVLASCVCLAQSDASVLGTVTDATSSVVPRAEVRLDNLRTGVSESAESDGNGIYRFLTVPIGQYRVTARGAGIQNRYNGRVHRGGGGSAARGHPA
jgi:hypothetical protein